MKYIYGFLVALAVMFLLMFFNINELFIGWAAGVCNYGFVVLYEDIKEM